MKEGATALLIVDAQLGFLEGLEAVPEAALVTGHLVALLASARSVAATVIHLQNDGVPGSVDEPGTPGWMLHPMLEPEQGEVVLRKMNDDGFEGTELEWILESRGVKRLVVGGLLSEMCVSATIRGALVRGLEVILVHDAHATYNVEDIPAAVVSRVAEHALGD